MATLEMKMVFVSSLKSVHNHYVQKRMKNTLNVDHQVTVNLDVIDQFGIHVEINVYLDVSVKTFIIVTKMATVLFIMNVLYHHVLGRMKFGASVETMHVKQLAMIQKNLEIVKNHVSLAVDVRWDMFEMQMEIASNLIDVQFLFA